ncbi:MAG: hypothetical protein ACOYOL_00475 [Chthoniobacterales bacterium]
MKKYIVTSLVAAVAATSAIAGPSKVVKEVIVPEDPCLFRDQEIQLDLFGLGQFYKGASDQFGGTSVRSFSGRPAWGGGVGLNYFFMKYVGVGIEQDLYGRESVQKTPTTAAQARNYDLGNYGYTRWATIGNLFLRYPICQWNLAPYIMVGGGANYGNVPNLQLTPATPAINGRPATAGTRYRMAGQGFGHVGGGLEYRVTKNIGVFSDARYMFSGVDGLANNQLMWRYGLRFAF